MLEETKLFGVLDRAYIQTWRKQIEEEIKDNSDYNLNEITECLKLLGVDEKTIKTVIARITDRLDYIHMNIEHQLAKLCIKIGIELGEKDY